MISPKSSVALAGVAALASLIAPAAAQPAAKPKATGTISGAVVWKGAAPDRAPLDRASDPVCAKTPRLAEDVVVTDGKLRDVHVHLKNGSAGTHAAPEPQPRPGEETRIRDDQLHREGAVQRQRAIEQPMQRVIAAKLALPHDREPAEESRQPIEALAAGERARVEVAQRVMEVQQVAGEGNLAGDERPAHPRQHGQGSRQRHLPERRHRPANSSEAPPPTAQKKRTAPPR